MSDSLSLGDVHKPTPEKKYRLTDGSLGTEYESLVQALKYWNAKKQEIEDKIEEYQLLLNVAEGHP